MLMEWIAPDICQKIISIESIIKLIGMKHGIHLHQLTVSAVERVALGERALMERSDLKIPDLLSLQVNHDDEDSLISMCGSSSDPCPWVVQVITDG